MPSSCTAVFLNTTSQTLNPEIQQTPVCGLQGALRGSGSAEEEALHPKSRAARRGPMDEMRQLVRPGFPGHTRKQADLGVAVTPLSRRMVRLGMHVHVASLSAHAQQSAAKLFRSCLTSPDCRLNSCVLSQT